MDSNNKFRCHLSNTASFIRISFGEGLWKSLKILFMCTLYIILGLSILFSLVKGIATIPSLPNSFLYLKIGYPILLIFALIFAICYIWLIIAANKLKKKQNAKPLQCYLGIRLKVLRFVDTPKESGLSWMEEILVLVKRSIINNLKGCKDEEVENLHEAHRKMKELYDDLFKKENTPTKNEMIKKAVCFTLKFRTIKHPADLQGKRRCYILIRLLSEILDTSTNSHGLSWCKCFSLHTFMISCISSCLQYLKSFSFYLLSRSCDSCLQCWNNFLQCLKEIKLSLTSSTKKYSLKSILTISSTIILFTVIPFIADNVTDIKVLILYWNMWSSSGERNIYKIIFSTDPYGPLEFPGTEIFMPLIYLSIFYGVSTMLVIFRNPLKKISNQFKTQIKMKTPDIEEKEEIICPSSIVERYDLPTDESSLESPTQCILQFGIYFSLIPLIRVLEELQLSDDKITLAYKDKLKFWENFALSGAISLFAITMGQVKKNLIFHEFNISWKQWVCYFLASMFATTFYVFAVTLWLITMLATNFDFAGFSNIANISSASNNPITDIIFMFVFAIIGLFTCPIISSITCSEEKKFKLPASRFSWLTSVFNVGNLPTSHHITRGSYNMYHNSTSKSPQLLYGIAEQAGASFLICCHLLCFSSHESLRWSSLPLNCTNCTFPGNSSIIDIQRYQEEKIFYLLPKFALSLDLRNYIIATMIIVPVCGLLSYLFLWLYFSMDNGFFDAVEIDYYFYNDNKIDNLQNDEDIESSGGNIKLCDKRVCKLITHDDTEHKMIEVVHEDTEQNSSIDWIQKWIDEEAEEDWYWYLWRKLSSWILKKKMTPINKFDMTGSWMDLTGDDGQDEVLLGDDGQEEVCQDGEAVLHGEEGTLEYTIRMSFPYYWKQNREKKSSKPLYSSCSCFCCL